jgi:nucleotide-binding universal stress UspA family protein
MIRRLGRLACLPAAIVLALPAAPAPAATAAESPRTPAATADGSAALAAILVVEALLAAGITPEEAVAQVSMLTDADLLVLAAHPAMVQVAGDNAALTRNLLLGLLVLGGIIALAAASEGGGAVITN